MGIDSRYFDGAYLEQNPDWDREDAAWKAAQVTMLLKKCGVTPASICDVGCGAGDVLGELQRSFSSAQLSGFDISPQLAKFWAEHPGIHFTLGEFHRENNQVFDVLLMLDVFEHVRDPFTFLEQSRRHAKHFVFHIPLDLCGLTVCRSQPLIRARRKVGHLHFYTKDLALETLRDCGYEILDWRYTAAASTLRTHRTFLTRLASIPRKIACAVNKDFGVRLLGGETLIVLAR